MFSSGFKRYFYSDIDFQVLSISPRTNFDNQVTMASQSSSYPILCASFNQDYSCFAVGTHQGFKIFDTSTGKLLYERDIGAFIIVEMLFSSSLLALVGAGEQPSLSPRRLCLFNTTSGTTLRELNFLTSVLAVCLNKKRLVVILLEKTYIYEINNLKIMEAIHTVPNHKGLYAFSSSPDSFLALPASATKGSVLVYNVIELQSHCEIDAHRSPLSAIVFSSCGMYIATASEQGTIIRIHLVSDATESYSFRRGTYPATIYSLSFAPSTELPDILLASSSSGSIHVFSLDFSSNQSPVGLPHILPVTASQFFRSRRSGSILGSLLPDSVTDALDPVHHHVLHRAVPAGVKSNAIICKADRIRDTTSSESWILRSTIAVITYGGYFLEYSFSTSNQNESSWTLEREFNLLAAVAAYRSGSSDARLENQKEDFKKA